ncbi:hypothetical protein [Microbacterium testaceum]|uniref:hypothetical protein n=1 Tax=Microbacterium testaceum TaxID=2033 RepID=UPI001057032C|nr:hypothetical protein [Microbacterium testaceum]
MPTMSNPQVTGPLSDDAPTVWALLWEEHPTSYCMLLLQGALTEQVGADEAARLVTEDPSLIPTIASKILGKLLEEDDRDFVRHCSFAMLLIRKLFPEER